MIVCFCFFFFKDTATTEIYTYCHTLSLHDALPICRDGDGNPARDLRLAVRLRVSSEYSELSLASKFGCDLTEAPRLLQQARQHCDWLGVCFHVGSQAMSPRSEEHTSELQSLIRISYAVFCLKKQKTQIQSNKR